MYLTIVKVLLLNASNMLYKAMHAMARWRGFNQLLRPGRLVARTGECASSFSMTPSNLKLYEIKNSFTIANVMTRLMTNCHRRRSMVCHCHCFSVAMTEELFFQRVITYWRTDFEIGLWYIFQNLFNVQQSMPFLDKKYPPKKSKIFISL